MKTSTKIIWGIVLVASYFHFKDEKKQQLNLNRRSRQLK